MTANNMNELNSMLSKELMKAMRVAANEVEKDMREETTGFYQGTKPKMYKRTGALGNTPRISAVVGNQHGASFDAYLDTTHQYTSGDNPSMEQVLYLANYGQPWITQEGGTARETLGKEGFWERAEEKMQSTLDKTLNSYFK